MGTLRNKKKMDAIVKNVYGNDAKYFEGRSYTKKDGDFTLFGLAFIKKPYPNECPDIARMNEFIEQCRKTFGNNCYQTKAFVWFSLREESYNLMWEEPYYL